MKHIILLGDSIFDNRSHGSSGKDTIANLHDQMPDGWTATLLELGLHFENPEFRGAQGYIYL